MSRKIYFIAAIIGAVLFVSAIALADSDTTAPSAINNLNATSITQSSVVMNWTSTGDDGNVGTSTSYDLRYSTSLITSGNWASATQVSGEPIPQVASSSETMTVSGLAPSTTYYFAIEAIDDAGNISPLSNVITFTTLVSTDTTAPSAITSLTASSPTQTTVLLSWTSPGDDGVVGTSTSYDIRYSTSLITNANWASATQVSGEPSPLVAGTAQSFTVPGLSPSTTYYFAIKAIDDSGNISDLSNIATAATLVSTDISAPSAVADLAASNATQSSTLLSWTSPGDDGAIGTASSYDIRYSTSNITSDNWASATQVSGEPAPLVEGTSQSMTINSLSPSTTYYFAIRAIDNAGNVSALSNIASITTLSSPPIPSATLTFSLKIKPEDLNLGSQGNWITVYLMLSGDYKANAIDMGSLLLNGNLRPDSNFVGIDRNCNVTTSANSSGLLLKFSRTEVQNLIGSASGSFALYLTGNIGGQSFVAQGTINAVSTGNSDASNNCNCNCSCSCNCDCNCNCQNDGFHFPFLGKLGHMKIKSCEDR
jgi:chitodextrinase